MTDYLTDDEIRCDAAGQQQEWHGESPTVDTPEVGHWTCSAQDGAGSACDGYPAPEERPIRLDRRRPLPVADILTPPTDTRRPPRRATLEPSLAEWRARCLLALSLVNHRRTDDGLSDADTTAVRGALMGEWDAA